jgi:hypothetical protein
MFAPQGLGGDFSSTSGGRTESRIPVDEIAPEWSTNLPIDASKCQVGKSTLALPLQRRLGGS